MRLALDRILHTHKNASEEKKLIITHTLKRKSAFNGGVFFSFWIYFSWHNNRTKVVFAVYFKRCWDQQKVFFSFSMKTFCLSHRKRPRGQRSHKNKKKTTQGSVVFYMFEMSYVKYIAFFLFFHGIKTWKKDQSKQFRMIFFEIVTPRKDRDNNIPSITEANAAKSTYTRNIIHR